MLLFLHAACKECIARIEGSDALHVRDAEFPAAVSSPDDSSMLKQGAKAQVVVDASRHNELHYSCVNQTIKQVKATNCQNLESQYIYSQKIRCLFMSLAIESGQQDTLGHS